MAAYADDGEIPESEKSAITIITGFLGAGKTTLVNYILKEQRDRKIAVVENEFGEVSIDDVLVEENVAAREDIITMDNGCVCCSIRGDLVRTFGMLAERRKEFDAFILETTGLADPAPILFTFTNNATISDHFRVDSVVCLVDAKNIGIHLDEVKPEGNVNEAEQQIAFADRILLNKCDLVDAEELEDVIERIRSINSFAEVIQTEKSRAPLDKITNLNSFSLEKLVEMDLDIEEEEEEDHSHSHEHGHGHDHVHDEHCGHTLSEPGHDHDHSHSHEHGHDHSHCEHPSHNHEHAHDHQNHINSNETEEHKKKKPKKVHNLSLVTSVGFSIETLLDVVKFNEFMGELLQTRGKDLYRTKGVLAFADQDDTKFVFQGVHEQINFGPTESPWKPNEPRISKLVFIGKDLDCEKLLNSLKLCTVEPDTAKVIMHKRA
mmetsp:Transcript_23737/g.23949  ORF Transcript_23737/g.23949 Transcript_23737/m.23949 type:complete len:434 (+) Transcript_23737:80-1381(+)